MPLDRWAGGLVLSVDWKFGLGKSKLREQSLYGTITRQYRIELDMSLPPNDDDVKAILSLVTIRNFMMFQRACWPEWQQIAQARSTSVAPLSASSEMVSTLIKHCQYVQREFGSPTSTL